MSKTLHRKVVIIGSGPAGNTAAIYAAGATVDPLLNQRFQPGGQPTIPTVRLSGRRPVCSPISRQAITAR